MAGALTLASCLGDNDDDDSVYNDSAIVGFTLGTLNKYTHTVSTKTGNDTVVKTSVTGSSYKMTIDHLGGRIYNVTPLPVGTDVKHVVCTITAKNNGLVALQSMTSDSLKWYSSTDSIDFSQPRTLHVMATDGTGSRDYVVELFVGSTTSEDFAWELVTTDPQLAGWTDRRLMADGDTVRLAEADSIIGASTSERYMIGSDGWLYCWRNGAWQEDRLDDDSALLPQAGTTACVSWPYASAEGNDYVLLVGTPRQADASNMRVWRKICPSEGGGQWAYMPFDDGNYHPLPRQEWLSMVYYDGAVLAIGSDMVMRQSRDQGITWYHNADYDLPAEVQGTKVTMAVDGRGRLWLLTNEGQLWRGV